MKTNYENIPANYLAATAEAEALRRQLEGGELEANTDGTLSLKGANDAPQSSDEKIGDVPAGVLGAEKDDANGLSPEVAAMINEFAGEDKPAKEEDSKKAGDVPGGVLGAERA